MSDSYDPHRSVSLQLTEVRTVLARARSALSRMDKRGISRVDRGRVVYPEYSEHLGDDVEQMRLALRAVVAALEPWDRTKK